MPNPLIPASAQEEEYAWLRYKDQAREEGFQHIAKHSFLHGYRLGAAGTGKDDAFRRTHHYLQEDNVRLRARVIDLERENEIMREHLQRVAAAVKFVGQ